MNEPDDLMAGDTLSGTMIAEPAGKTDTERAQSQDELNGYVVEMENQKTSATAKSFKWIIPATFTGTTTALILKDRQGNEVARTEIPVSPGQPNTQQSSSPTQNDFRLPTIGQAGRPIQVQGPFDGDFANTNIRVGGESARLLAESPRKIVAQSPQNVVGSTEIECQEQGVTAKGAFRNLDITLSAPKTNLRKGEETTLHIEVSGLEGIQKEVLLRLENKSPSVIRLGGGDVQAVAIHPVDVQAGGVYPTTRTLTGTGSGGFTINAAVSDSQPNNLNVGNPTDADKAKAKKLEDEAKKLREEAAALRDYADEADKGNGPKAVRERGQREKERKDKEAKEAKEREKKLREKANDSKAKGNKDGYNKEADKNKAEADKATQDGKDAAEKDEKKAQGMEKEGVKNPPDKGDPNANPPRQSDADRLRRDADAKEREAGEKEQKASDLRKT